MPGGGEGRSQRANGDVGTRGAQGTARLTARPSGAVKSSSSNSASLSRGRFRSRSSPFTRATTAERRLRGQRGVSAGCREVAGGGDRAVPQLLGHVERGAAQRPAGKEAASGQRDADRGPFCGAASTAVPVPLLAVSFQPLEELQPFGEVGLKAEKGGQGVRTPKMARRGLRLYGGGGGRRTRYRRCHPPSSSRRPPRSAAGIAGSEPPLPAPGGSCAPPRGGAPRLRPRG